MLHRASTIALFAAALVALAAPPASSEGSGPAGVYGIPLAKRRFELTYVAEVPEFPRGAKRVEVWIPVPGSDEQQAVAEPSWRHDARRGDFGAISTDARTGNRYAMFLYEAPFPESAAIEMRVEVTRGEHMRKDFRGKGARPLSEAEREELADWLKPDRLVPIDGRIAEIAKRVAGGETNVLNLARRFYDHVREEMAYDKSVPGWGEGDALRACDIRAGNCSDFHALFIGLCRAAGIPARFECGFPIPEKRGSGEIAGYHCWAQFHVPGYGWVPVDVSEADKHPELAEYYFGALTEDRVKCTVDRDLVLVPPQKGEPLNFFVYPYAEADGKPWDGVKRRFAYRDLE